MLYSAVVIGLGAAAGAIIRWLLGLVLNPLCAHIPLGTLVANLLGGFGIGLALGVCALFPSLNGLWRLAVITGFLGGLTTFSTFSAEVAAQLQESRFFWAAITAGAHLLGSLLMTFLGLACVSQLRAFLWSSS